MNNSSTDMAEDKRHATAESERSVADRSNERYSANQLPTPPTSNNASCDYSDVASVDSQDPTLRPRRRQRGGRRRKKGGKLQSVSEIELPKGGPSQDIPTDIESKEEVPPPEDYDAEELEKARLSRRGGSSRKRSLGTASRTDTGIKAFNLARAEESGGRRPVGITIERPKSTGKSKVKKGNGNKKMEERPEGEDEGEGDENSGDTETETRRPVSIRLDLNLEVEIFLRAKIKGDVTVTFL